MKKIFSLFSKQKIEEKQVIIEEISNDKKWFCIFSWNEMFFNIDHPYTTEHILNDWLWEYCHFSWEKDNLWSSKLSKPIFYKNYYNAIQKYWKEKCIPKDIKDNTCYEPVIRKEFKIAFSEVILNIKNDLEILIKNFKYEIKNNDKDYQLIKKRTLADIIRLIDEYYLWFNVNFSFFKALNEWYQFNWYYKYCLNKLWVFFDKIYEKNKFDK